MDRVWMHDGGVSGGIFASFSNTLSSSTGIEVCTGPLGQGICNAVGLAMSERHLAATFNEPGYDIFDHHTYVICGDGCMQEGVASEASSLAGHLGLGRLIVMYDDNNITIDGDTGLSFTEDVLKRYEAYGWHTQTVSDVTGSLDDLRIALATARGVTDKPSMIKVKTAIGYGSPSKEGSAKAHGAPLGKEDLAGAKKFYGLPEDKSFYVPPEVQAFYDTASTKADSKRLAWEEMFAKYAKEHSAKAGEISRRFANKLPEGLMDKLPTFEFGTDKDKATRQFSQGVLGAIAPSMPELVGGSADLTPSNLTNYPGVVDFQKDSYDGRYLRFGVREHGMGSICNGMFAHGGIRPYCATFLVFSGYMIGAMRLSALSKFGVIYIMTHDSIGLGEDGPTHQPVETLEQLRSMPNMLVFRPADSNESSASYKVALERDATPSVICCSRTGVPALENSSIAKACTGAYTAIEPATTPELILVATGSEVGPTVVAAKQLTESGIATRVVSMPCQELFLEQSAAYQKEVLPGNIPTMSIEASSIYGWHRFSHAQVGMTSFGASGSGADVFAHFGFTAENIASKGKALVEFYKESGPVPDLNNRPVFEAVSSH
jgi:transketolase